MTPASPHIREFVRGMLLAEACGAEPSPEFWADALDRINTRLQRRFTSIIGREGFQALLSRALILASREGGWLEKIQVDAGGGLTGLREALLDSEAAEVEAGCISLLAQLVGLLNSLIGFDLTQRLMSAARYPIAPVKTNNGTEDARE